MTGEVSGWAVDETSNASDLRLSWYAAGQIWAKAIVRWEGCVDYERAFNVPFPEAALNNVERLHICNPQDMIRQLLGLIQISQAHFKARHN